jgi:ATP-dependent Clp protease ATP-binding subunit ClpC
MQELARRITSAKSWGIIGVDVEGVDAEAIFTFKGATKAQMPDSPEDLAEAPTA